MKRIVLAMLSLSLLGLAAEKSLELKNLPAAVQKTITEQAKGAEIKNISMEKEKGVSQYEVETMLNGKHRDFNVDSKGTLLVMEDETSIDAVPAPVKTAMVKAAGTGKITMVETVNKGSVILYEAAITSKAGKKSEALFKADGTPTKD
jgi:uncharacterized membrane protein YkoI